MSDDKPKHTKIINAVEELVWKGQELNERMEQLRTWFQMGYREIDEDGNPVSANADNVVDLNAYKARKNK